MFNAALPIELATSSFADTSKDFRHLAVRFTDDKHTVLASETFELVIHSLTSEAAVGEPPLAREDSYIKPFFPVTSLAEARERPATLGGQSRPQNEEWEARGFRACEAIDPDGNVIQFREDAARETEERRALR